MTTTQDPRTGTAARTSVPRPAAAPAAPAVPAVAGPTGAPPAAAPAPRSPVTASTAQAPPSVSEGALWLSSATTMLAIVCLWTLAQLLVLGGVSQSREQSLLYDEFRTELAGGVAPLGPVIEPGTPVALLEIPAIDVEQVVVEGTTSGDLLAGPGHQRNTALPGQEGISFVLGRATTYGGPFGDLGDLAPGDEITATTAQGAMTFRVLDVRRPGDPQPQPLAAGAARLTLVSAEGTGFLGSLRPGSAVYVDADSTKAVPAPPGRPTDLPEAERVMNGDPGVLPLLTLYLALLVALTLGVVAARRRWSRVLVWTVAGPVAIALAWASTDVGVRLLPNLL